MLPIQFVSEPSKFSAVDIAKASTTATGNIFKQNLSASQNEYGKE